LGLAMLPWIPAIAVCTFLVGASQFMVGPPLVAAMVDVVPEADRPRAFNLHFWAFNLGTAFAGLLAGQLAGFGFTPLFLIEAAATFGTLCILAIKVPETLKAPVAASGGGLGTVLRDRWFGTFFGLTVLLAILTSAATTILPLA